MKKYIKYLVIVLIIAAAIILWGHYRKAKNMPEWRTDTPSQGAIREVVTATGSLNPYVLVNVGTEVSGKIEKIYKDFNDRVKKGELLAKLDTEILRTNLDAAKGELAKANTAMNEAKLDYDLLKELFKKNMSPDYDVKKAEFKVETAQQNLANAKLTLQRAQKNLDNAYITSPIDGIIVSRDVDEGQTVAASMSSPTLFMIANNLDQMQITANVDEADIGKIKLELPVEFTVDAYPTNRFEGNVKQIRLNPTTDSNVVSYSVIIDAANPERKLLPGMTTNVTIEIQAKENVLRVPETATQIGR
ncbi:MAG: efflux RND transporter periplasmic adaptor subunit, partial [Candidatus Cloacimonas sp.]|nr:efflux RND transporter periplasmic adaptor subunit [Candidatus Cloacimonas sp.]